MPRLNPLDTVTLVLAEMRDILTAFPQNNLLTGENNELLTALNDIQNLLGLPSTITKVQEEAPTSKGAKQEFTKQQTRDYRPTTSSQTLKVYPNCTIIRKKFGKHWYEGEISSYDTKNEYYQIKYTDGDSEEMTYREVQQYKKPLQQYSPHNQGIHQQRPLARTFICKVLRAGCIWDESLKKWMNLEDLLWHPNPEIRTIWEKSSQKEYGNLFQGFRDTKGMDVCQFIKKEEVPKHKKVTYPRTVVAYRPEKVDNPYRTRITAGGDQLDYDGETSTNSASMTTIKIHQNSVLSTPPLTLDHMANRRLVTGFDKATSASVIAGTVTKKTNKTRE